MHECRYIHATIGPATGWRRVEGCDLLGAPPAANAKAAGDGLQAG